MSVFGDFQQVWSQRFPDSALPSAWEEDIRANLEKHKQKVVSLQEQLEKEEIYVEYLERLLSDIEERKKFERKADSEEINVIVSKKNESTYVPTAPPCESADNETSADKCVSELSMLMKSSLISQKNNETETGITGNDPSSFVTVIEVNGLKNNIAQPTAKQPPVPPIKPKLNISNSLREQSGSRSASIESVRSSSEHLSPVDEPYYDVVATDSEESLPNRSKGSSTENVFSNSSTLPLHAKHSISSIGPEPQSPEPQSNYVNIEYFIRTNLSHDSDEEDDIFAAEENILQRSNDNGSYASSSSLESSTPATRRKFNTMETEKLVGIKSPIYKSIVRNIIDSETNYVQWLHVFITYMKAINASVSTSQPIITESEFRTIFYKIPEIHQLHENFLDSLRQHAVNWDTRIGDSFKLMAKNLELYGAFLSNYGRAIDTARKCSGANPKFADVSKNIFCKQLGEQTISIEELLHKPVARVQKNALVLHDLLKHMNESSSDHGALVEALQLTQKFLDQYNMIQTKSMFPASDRAQRRLVKNSFIVEYVDGSRKLRHLFLFNDVIACAKYKVIFQSSGRNEKYTFELKWFIPVEDIFIIEESTANPHEVPNSDLVALKSQASNARDLLRLEENTTDDKANKIRLGRGQWEKVRKRLLDLESQLVLVSPNLMFRMRQRQNPKQYTFFLSSEFERTQWIEAISTLKQTSSPPAPNVNFSMLELQTWITACRNFLKTNMGSYLLRSGHDESLLVGDLHITIYDLQGLEYQADLFICIEVDFYGHFFRKAKTKMICKSNNPVWNETFVIDLEGCENLRILIYKETSPHATLLGKHTQQLSRHWLNQSMIEKKLKINGCDLKIGLKFIPFEVSLRRVPGKGGPLFGEKISQTCKRQKRDIPFIVFACVREVERRGMSEVGIYRVSGSASDLAKLRKSFETNSYEAEQFLKEVDIHSVTGILRSYLRELPEALFTDTLYPSFLEAFNQSNENFTKRMELLRENLKKLPKENKATIEYLLGHLIRIYQHENENKMSLHNLATVFGPTLLRTSSKIDSKQKNHLASETVDVMAQAGILYCFLQDLSSNCKKDC